MRGSPERGYFVPACVGSGRWADFERCSRIHACGFRCLGGKTLKTLNKSILVARTPLKTYSFLQQKLLGPHSGAMFFSYFFIPLSSKTPIFESFFGRWPVRNALKTRCFSWEGYQKVKKTSRDSSDCQKHMVKCQVANMLTVKTQWKWTSKIEKVNFPYYFVIVFVVDFSFS